jgi:tetratricopeptide (TPR) repeat protein
MTGEIDEARELIGRARERFHELGLVLREHNTALGVAQIDLHAGDPFAAERTLRESCAALEALGETGYLSTQLAFLAVIVSLVGDPEEALALAERSRELTAHGDVLWTAYWCTSRAHAYARLGRHDEALPLVQQAVELVAQSDDPHTLATVKGEAAAVLLLGGERTEARRLLEEALALHEAKGCVPCAARTRGQLAELAA